MRLLKGLLVVALITAMVVVVGCSGQDQNVEISYVDWACATASSYLVANIVEAEFGIDVELNSMNAGIMWQSVANGDTDLLVAAWLPGTHADYYSQFGSQVDDLGPNYEGALIGLVVPTYMDIDSIEDLNDHADELNGRIVGIDSGAGIMSATATAIEEYGLDLDLLESSDAAMTTELRTAINNNEWIVVTGWAPHWKFADFDLKFLEDPKGVFGGEETINTIVREGLETDNPGVYAFLQNYYLTAAQLGELIGMMEEYDDNNEAAQAWMEQNQSVIDGWMGR